MKPVVLSIAWVVSTPVRELTLASELYDRLFARVYRDGHKKDGRIREVYLVADAESPGNCVTEIQIAVA